MDLHQLKTFVTVAREGTITRASAVLHLSQPAVSAHIKAIEDTIGLSLFDRTAKGMTLTPDGARLLEKAEGTLAAHRALLEEAHRSRGRIAGKLRLGVATSSGHEAVGKLLATLAARFPEVEVTLKHGTSKDVLAGLRSGALDAGFYNEAGAPDPELDVTRVGAFTIHVVAPPGLVPDPATLRWSTLARVPWIYPTESTCCGRSAARLFEERLFQPSRVIGVDRVEMTRTLVAGGIGVGLLHADVAAEAIAGGDVVGLLELAPPVEVLFARLHKRAGESVLSAAAEIVTPPPPSPPTRGTGRAAGRATRRAPR